MGTIERLFFEISNTCIPYTENLSLEEYYATPTPEKKKISLASFIERIHAENMKTLRVERNKRLTETDWTQTTDIGLENEEEWVAYRQALRDLPANTEDPTNPEWPTLPQVKIVPGKTKLEKTQATLQAVSEENQKTLQALVELKKDLQSEKEKVATMELLVASLVKRVGDLENLVI